MQIERNEPRDWTPPSQDDEEEGGVHSGPYTDEFGEQ